MPGRVRSCANCSALFAVLLLANVKVLTAQSEEPKPKWSLIVLTTVKPEMRAEYESWQKEISAAYKKAEIPSRAVLQTLMGNLMEYVSVSPLSKFGDMDGMSPVERALGKEAAAALMRKGGMYITSAHRVAALDLEDLTIRAPVSEPAPYAMVTTLHVIPGKGPEFAALMKDEYTPAMKKAEVKNFWVSQTVFGGDPNERVTVRPMQTMSEIDAGPLTRKALGAEGSRKLMSRTAGIVDSVQYRIVRYRSELSYRLEPPVKSASK